MKNKGMSLMELLAVIALLGILLIITVPAVSELIRSSALKTFEIETNNILQAIENKKTKNSKFDVTSINIETMPRLLGISNSNYESITVKIVTDKIYITIVGKDKWAGYITCGTSDDVSVVTSELECL